MKSEEVVVDLEEFSFIALLQSYENFVFEFKFPPQKVNFLNKQNNPYQIQTPHLRNKKRRNMLPDITIYQLHS